MNKFFKRSSHRKTNQFFIWKPLLSIAILSALILGFNGCSTEFPTGSQDQLRIEKNASKDVVPGQYIVVLKSTNSIGTKGMASKITAESIANVAYRANVEPVNIYTTVINGFSSTLTNGEYQALQNDPDVSYIEPDHTVKMIAQSVPWGISTVKAPAAHTRGVKGAGVKVGIIDTGIDYNHPDLSANYAGGIDYVNGDNDPMDDEGHGTHVSGTVAALDNSIGVIGVAPAVSLYGIKVLDQNGSGYYSDVIAGIDWAAANGMDVINMSLGGSSGTNALKTSCDNAYASGVVICAAAGNDYGWSISYPAKYSSAIAVTAIDQNNNLAYFSNVGPEAEVTAPGVSVNSTMLGGGYGNLSGTSMATPHTTGVAALIWSTGQYSSASAVRTQMTSTCVDLGPNGRDNSFGYGLVDADAATAGSGGGGNPPVANFSGSPTSGTTPLAVAFTDQSTNSPTSWTWDFGDGGTSTQQNPNYTYNTAGTYTVSLTVSNANGSDQMVRNNYITVTVPAGNPPVANFSGNPTSGTAPLSVNFTDQSTNSPTNWTWDFGDGGTSSQQNPNYTYNTAGTYTVSLTVSNADGSDQMIRNNYISVTSGGGGGPTGEGFILSRNADFSTDDRSFTTNETIYMKVWTDLVDFNNIKKSEWELRDANKNKIRQSLTNHLDNTYTASFNLGGLPSNATSWTWKGKVEDNNRVRYNPTATITVTAGGGGNQAPTANANGPYSGTAGSPVSFSSAGSSDPDGTITGYNWDFGDGGTSTAANPNYTYASAGTYTVTLTVTDDQGATGSNSTTANITSGGGGNQAPTANANGPYSGTAGNAVSFSSAGSSDPDGTITGYSWDFGDGGTSTAANPNYTYTSAGTYTVTLTVTDDQGATGSNSTTASITSGGGGSDNVTISKAQYDQAKQKLDVRAVSDNPNATLTVVGYGVMTYKANKNRWELKLQPVSPGPTTITVTSDFGGSATSNVTWK